MGDLAVTTPFAPSPLLLPPPRADETSLAAARTGFLFSNPVESFLEPPLVIRDSVVIISNPLAGSFRANRVKGGLIEAMDLMEAQKKLVLQGQDTIYLKTHADPQTRVAAILHVIKKSDPKHPPIIVAIGGDGTFADVVRAVYEASEEGFRPTVVPVPGGTACDLSREFGVPKNPKLIPAFLANAQRTELFIMTASFDGGPEQIVIHSQGNGISGKVFGEVQKIRDAGGKVSVATYARALLKGVAGIKPFFVKINGGEPKPVGEVLALVDSTSVGSIVRVPLPKEGGAVLAVPVVPNLPGPMRFVPGIGPVFDVLWRGMSYMLGDQTVIKPDSQILLLNPKRFITIKSGEEVLLEFVDAEGNPKSVPGLINGDPTKPAARVLLRGKTTTIATLAAYDSAFMVRKGLAKPQTMRGAILGGLSDCAGHFGTPAALALMAAWEVHRDNVQLAPAEQRIADLSSLAGLAAADAFAIWNAGTISFFAELPLIIGPFGVGYELAAAGSDFAAQETGVAFFNRDRAGSRIAGIAGGWATVWGAMKFVGVETWKAAASQMNGFLVRTLSGAGEAVGSFLMGAVRFLGKFRLSLPVILPPGMIEQVSPEPENPRRIPTA